MTDQIDPRIPAGWTQQSPGDTFSNHAGPFWLRDAAEKKPGIGFLSAPMHTNFHGALHGGVLMTLADMALFNICWHAIGPFRGLTLSTTCDFVAAGPVGEFIEATGEITKATGTILFARGLVTAKGKTLASFSGSLKRLIPRETA